MKKLSIIFVIICLAISSLAQPPEKMSYQAMIRNTDQQLITNQQVTLHFSILQSSPDGPVVYEEVQNATTNENGLVSIEFGGTVQFETIDWGIAPHYLKVEVDPTGGVNYTISGISQLLSVPYALYAKKASASESNVWEISANNAYYTGGNVGIGTTTPSYTLDVSGDINFTGDLRQNGIILTNGAITETDPIFQNSPAQGITNTLITFWNTAYNWGNHATAGYLSTFSESDPIFANHSAYNITSNTIKNWDSAYNWGNHADMGYLTSVSAESDPIFTASDAYGIAASDISNWTTAFSWGNHANEGYLTTFTESDPIFGASAASGISSTNISNWNTAYGWGNHATQGYLTSFSETDPYAVKLTGNQSISGEKTFNSRTNILQIEVSPVNTGNRYGYIDFHGDNTYTDYALRLIRNNTGVNAESWLKHRGTGALYISADDAGKIGFRTSNNTRMYIDANGEIGIGTTAPGAKFEVNSAGYTGDILFQVKDNAGNPVFTVYPDAVEVSVPGDGTKAPRHGSFIVSGRDDKTKASTPITRITKENYLIGHNVAPNITGTKNSILGYEAAHALTSGVYNTILGYQAGMTTSTASSNVFIGYQAGVNNTTNGGQIFIGRNAGSANNGGDNNIYIGYQSGFGNASGQNNVCLGYNSMLYGDGSYNTYLGYETGISNGVSSYNTLIGYMSGRGVSYGNHNTCVGYASGANLGDGKNNILIGDYAGYKVAGDYNTQVGNYAGYNNEAGNYNVFLGNRAGYYETGSYKLYVDVDWVSDPLIYGDFSTNKLNINGSLGVNRSNAGYTFDMYSTTYIANTATYAGRFWHDYSTDYSRGIIVQAGNDNGSSSGTIVYIQFQDGNGSYVGNLYSENGVMKTAAKSASKSKGIFKAYDKKATELIKQLNVVNYKLDESNAIFQTGFIAEDVKDIIPEMVFFEEDANEYSIAYSSLIPILTKAIQEQQKKIEEIEQLKKEIEVLKQLINERNHK